MKFFDDYRFTQQVRSQVRRHGFWAMRHRSPEWPFIHEDWEAAAGVTAETDRLFNLGGSPAPDWWAQNREGYGFLLANEKIRWVVGCLPVGETWFYGDSRGAFALLEAALHSARRYAAGWDLKIAGMYHTDFGARRSAITNLVPPGFSDLFLYVRSNYEGWGTWGEYVAGRSEDGDLERLVVRHDVALRLRRRWNQRRILKGWKTTWSQCEYLGGQTPASIEQRAFALAEALNTERKRRAERENAVDDPPDPPSSNPAIPANSLETWQHSPRVEIHDSADPLERFLLDAIREKRTVRFTFIGVEETTRRTVRPIRLVRVEDFDRTYLEGYCETRQALRTFSLHRIAAPSHSRSRR